ncbi:MAG: energy-coupling factor transporter transmembrane component T [Chloroflexota bacterium]
MGDGVGGARRGRRMHPTAWLVWVASAATVALLIRNPWYLAELGAIAVAIRWKLSGQRPGRSSLGFILSLMAFPALLNLAFSRAGDTVLLRLPLPVIGGPYTLEALLFGLTAGVQIACVLAVMMVLGYAVTAVDLLRRTPPGFYPVGVSATIGLNFAPQARKAFAAIREAQQVRGHEPRGWRDVPSLVTPLVVLSLESALGLAEGMVARGWGRCGLQGWRRWMVPTGWMLMAVGLAIGALIPSAGLWALACLGAGVSLLWVSLRRQIGGSRYRPVVWHHPDTLVTGLSLGVVAVFLFFALTASSWLGYYPYPQATWPAFRPALALGLVLLAMPLGPGMNHD